MVVLTWEVRGRQGDGAVLKDSTNIKLCYNLSHTFILFQFFFFLPSHDKKKIKTLLSQWSPNFLASEMGFVKDSFSTDSLGDGFGMKLVQLRSSGISYILVRSMPPRSLACAVHNRICTAMKIYCCRWSDRWWSSGHNASLSSAHLLLCGQVPDRP